MGHSLTWISKIQTRISLSIMETECIDVSQCIRELIAIREVLCNIQIYVILGKIQKVVFRIHSNAFTLARCIQGQYTLDCLIISF